MKIDLELGKKVFAEYVSNYDKSDLMIIRKVEHTYRVLEMSIRIAKSLSLSEEDVKLAGVIGLLHDIGRFEQYRLAHSYNDSQTGIDHAHLGVQVLFEQGKIKEFLPETREFDDIIKNAVEEHNKLAIKEGLTARELLQAKIIRDADKIDILEIFLANEQDTIQIAKNNGFEITSNVNEELVKALFDNKQVDRSVFKYFLDWYLNMLTFFYDINYPESIKIIKEKDFVNIHINQAINIVPSQRELLEKIRKHMIEYLNNKTY